MESSPERLQENLPDGLTEAQPVAQNINFKQKRDISISQQYVDLLGVDSPQSVSSMSSFLPLDELLNSSLTSDNTTPGTSRPSSLKLTPIHSKAKSPIRDEGEHVPALEKPTYDMQLLEMMNGTPASKVSQEANSTPPGLRQQNAFEIPRRSYQSIPRANRRRLRYSRFNKKAGQQQWHDRPDSSISSQLHHDETSQGNRQSSYQNNENTERRNEDSSPLPFRESTADFRAMTPQSRDTMLFHTLKTVIQHTRRE